VVDAVGVTYEDAAAALGGGRDALSVDRLVRRYDIDRIKSRVAKDDPEWGRKKMMTIAGFEQLVEALTRSPFLAQEKRDDALLASVMAGMSQGSRNRRRKSS